ncbi:MAG: T9SS type A sorting domain-containing protein [Bacteroidetes bacterium]|nr:MAG: T9SS type A sorting domain-containing protein [Bacteroidota bacterium]
MLTKPFSFSARLFTGFFLLLFLGTGIFNARAQVTVAGAVVGNGVYGTLGAAFTAINAGAQGGAIITITITANTVEPSAATLNQSATPWTSLTITPSGVRSVTGSIPGPALINLNGADNVSINGLNSGGNSLSINNQSTSAATATILFTADAKNNLVTNCTILGSSTGSAASASGATVLFSSSTLTGNEFNTVSNNDIGPSGANLPYQAVKSVGTAGKDNKNNTIDNNLIHDFFSASNVSNSRGIIINTNSTAFTITNNKIYQSTTRTATVGSQPNLFSFIDIEFGSGYTITGNVLGFANSGLGGYTILNGGAGNVASNIHAMIINQTTAVPTVITSNIISGIDLSSSRGSGTSGENVFIGVHFSGAGSGTISFVGNTIGSGTAVNAIYVRSTATTVAGPKPVAGIFNRTSLASILIDNNVIGGITFSFTGTVGQDVFQLNGILNEGDGAFNMTNNIIGGSVANSITSTQTGGNIVGIHNTKANVQVNMVGNIIRNLTHLGQNTGINHNSSVIGIMERVSFGNIASVITNNQIYNLTNSFGTSSAQIHVKGILMNPFGALSGNDLVEANSIHSLDVASTAVGSSINGIHLILNGAAFIFNNMISLGNGLTGNKQIIGIRQDGMTSFTHHNSIRIMGTATGTDYSACYSYRVNGYTFRSWNNIFYNERTGGANNHYALHTTALVTNYQASYNLYYTAGPGFAMYNNTAYGTLAALFGVTSPWNDPLNTKNLPVVFTSATDLHTSDINVRNAAFTPLGPPVTKDYDGTTRPACVDIGADEYDAAIIPGTAFTWLGGVSTEWCQPCNWDRETVPLATDDAIIKDDRPRYPLLQNSTCVGNEAIHDFTILPNATSSKSGSINLGTFTLSVTGDVNIAGTCSCTGATALTALNTGLLDLTGTTQSQSVDIRGADGSYPGTLCKLRVNKTQPTGAAGSNHEAYLRGNLIILYNLDFANGVLLSKTAGTFDANELTAVNYKTITVQSNESNAVTRQTIGAQNTRNGFFQGRLSRRIRTGPLEYLFPLGFRMTGGTGVLANYFYTPALVSTNSVATGGQYLTATYLHDQSNPTADGVGIGFTGHGCLNAFEIDDQGGATASTCNNKEIDILSSFYWDLQETTTPAANGDPVASPGALGAVNYNLETAGDVYALLAQDGLTGSELRLLRRPSVVIPGNAGQGPFVTTEGTHNGTDISANTGIAQYSIVAASLKGARRDGLTVFGGFASAGNGPSPLPVELLNFQAERMGDKKVLCTWETATEINNDYFEIEAARDRGGVLVFEKIGVVPGSGTSSQIHSYSFIDEHPQPGRNYYRLRQIDYDGTAGYSKMVVVQFSSGKKFDLIAASPNPFNANPVLFLQTEYAGQLHIKVENSLGQIILKKDLELSKGSSSLTLDLSSELPSGLYFVRTIFDEEQTVSRLMKQ